MFRRDRVDVHCFTQQYNTVMGGVYASYLVRLDCAVSLTRCVFELQAQR